MSARCLLFQPRKYKGLFRYIDHPLARTLTALVRVKVQNLADQFHKSQRDSATKRGGNWTCTSLFCLSYAVQIKASALQVWVWGWARTFEPVSIVPAASLLHDRHGNKSSAEVCGEGEIITVNTEEIFFCLLTGAQKRWWICRGIAICLYEFSVISWQNCMSTCERRMASDLGSANYLGNLCATRMFAILTPIITSN